MPQYSTGLETRQRLLQAAAEVFAEHGFRYAKVSDICQLAGANAAAVNYHFGDKEQLYLAVIHWAYEQEKDCASWTQVDSTLPPPEQLRQFVTAFMENTLLTDKPTWLDRLMGREMTEPTVAMDYFIEQAIRPTINKIEEIVAANLGPQASAQLVERCAASVLGQCVIYQHARAVVPRLSPGFEYDAETIQALADHVTDFSLAAFRGLSEQLTASPVAVGRLGNIDSGTDGQTLADSNRNGE